MHCPMSRIRAAIKGLGCSANALLQLRGKLRKYQGDLPLACDVKTKAVSKIRKMHGMGYRMHLYHIDGDILISAILSTAPSL